MLTREHNELLTRTGPGTPMGELMRRYWIPILLAGELADNDGAPVRVTLLGERLLAWRDTAGRYALTGEFCAHRGVSLWFGRNEDNGLRCPYHGWKYDHAGRCIEVPSEPEDSGFCSRIRLRSGQLIERGGILWAYLGTEGQAPPPPAFEWAEVPAPHRYSSKRLQECNWLQAMEGGIDSSHVSFLHSGELNRDPLHRDTRGARYQGDRRPHFEVVASPGGLHVGARRRAEPGHWYWRISQWIMPFFTMVPPYGDNALNAHAFVPVDDNNSLVWTFTYHPVRPLTATELEVMAGGGGIHTRLIPGSFRPVINRDNDYMMDRAAQKAGTSYSGVSGIAAQDASIQESMGVIQDRTREHLVATDNALIMARNALRRAVVAASASGTAPPGLTAAAQRVRAATFVLPDGVGFAAARGDDLTVRAGVAPTSI